MRKTLLFTATLVGVFFGIIAEGEARPACPYGKIYRPSLGVCQAKARAPQQYVKRYVKHRYKRPAIKRTSVARPATPRATGRIPSLECDTMCRLTIDLHRWARDNRQLFVQEIER